MKKKIERTNLIRDLVKRDEENAARQLESARSRLDLEEERMLEVEEYYTDYEEKIGSRRTGVSADELIRSRNLLARLADAKNSQKIQVDNAQAEFNRTQTVWHGIHLKGEVLADLIERLKRDHQTSLNKKEQALLDEWVNLSRIKSHNKL